MPLECIDQRKQSHDGDSAKVALKIVQPSKHGAECNPHHNRHGKYAHALGSSTRHQKHYGSQRPQPLAKTALHHLVCGNQIAAKVLGNKHEADDYPPNQVTHHQLQKAEVLVEGHSRYADNGQSARLRR
jgi:hypothetical protein